MMAQGCAIRYVPVMVSLLSGLAPHAPNHGWLAISGRVVLLLGLGQTGFHA